MEMFAFAGMLLKLVCFIVGATFAYKAVKERGKGNHTDAVWFMLCALLFLS